MAEIFGNLEDVFFKDKMGNNIMNTPQKISTTTDTNNELKDVVDKVTTTIPSSNAKTIIRIDKSYFNDEVDKDYELAEQEEFRLNTKRITNYKFISLINGNMIVIKDIIKMYDNSILYQVETPDGNKITFPRHKFIGSSKEFIPYSFYLHQTEKIIDDAISNNINEIYKILETTKELNITKDEQFLELVLDTPIDVNINVPNGTKIKIIYDFDLLYKIMQLEMVIIFENKIVSLIFNDMWF